MSGETDPVETGDELAPRGSSEKRSTSIDHSESRVAGLGAPARGDLGVMALLELRELQSRVDKLAGVLARDSERREQDAAHNRGAVKHALLASAWGSAGVLATVFAIVSFLGWSNLNQTIVAATGKLEERVSGVSNKLEEKVTQGLSGLDGQLDSTARAASALDGKLDSFARQVEESVEKFPEQFRGLSRQFETIRENQTAVQEQLAATSGSIQDVRAKLDQLFVKLSLVAAALESSQAAGSTPGASAGAQGSTDLWLAIVDAIARNDVSTLHDVVPKYFAFRNELSPQELIILAKVCLMLDRTNDAVTAATIGIQKAESKQKPGQSLTEADTNVLSLLYSKRGTAYVARQEHDLGKTDFQKSLELDPRNREALNNLSSIYFSEKLFDDAIQSLEKAVTVGKEDGQDVSAELDNLALACLSKAVRIRDSNGGIDELNATLSQAAERSAEAYSAKAAASLPAQDLGHSALIRAMVLAESGKVKDAAEWLAKAYKHYPALQTLIAAVHDDPIEALKAFARVGARPGDVK